MLLYGRRNSINVIPVLWCLEELELKFERIVVGGSFGGLDDPEFRALNPMGRIPVLDDDGFVLFESHAIIRYLADVYGGDRLQARTHRERALNDQGMEWHKTTFHPPFVALFQQFTRFEPDAREERTIAASVRACADALKAPDLWLTERDYLGGDRFGIGDMPLGAALDKFFALPVPRPSFAAIENWLKRLRARPAYQNCVMRPFGLSPAEHRAIEQADP